MNLHNLLKVILFTPGVNGRWGLPVIFTGKPGTGKTTRIRNMSASMNLETITLIASLREPVDFAGYLVPENGVLKRYAEKWVNDAINYFNCVVFLDELNTAPPSVQKALLRVVLEGVVGDRVLPNGVRFIAAQNSIEDAADGYDLSPALANRFGHLDWESPSAEDWAMALCGNFGNDSAVAVSDVAAEELQDAVMEQWPAAYDKATALISGFIRTRPELLYAKSRTVEATVASPRTWEMAARALAGCEIHGADNDTKHELIGSFIGSAVAAELVAFMQNANLPDIEKLLSGEITYTCDPRRMDIVYAVLGGLINTLKRRGAAIIEAEVNVVFNILNQAHKAGSSDIAASGITMLSTVAGAIKYINNTPAKEKMMMEINNITAV